MNSGDKDRTLLLSADKLAEEVDALAIISFIPTIPDLELKTPIINIMDIHPEVLHDHSMLALLDYCSNHVIDAVVQYRIMTRNESGKVVAVFPYAILIYDIDSTTDEFTAESFADIVNPDVVYSVLSRA